MSATEELRRLLDERGVHWWEGHGDCDGYAGTLWDGIGGRWYAGGMTGVLGNRLYLETPADRTPEQAIAATLVRDTCKLSRGTSGLMHVTTGHCSECGAEVVKGTKDGYRSKYCQWCGAKVVE